MTSELLVTSEPLPDSQVVLAIDVPRETVDAAFERAVDRLGRRVKIQGFRPGHAPRALIEAKLGRTAIRDEVVDTIVPGLIAEAIHDQSLEPISRPQVEVVELGQGSGAKLRAKVFVMPEVKLPVAGTFNIEYRRTEISDEMVEQQLLALRKKDAEVEAVEREVRIGDRVIANIEIRLEGAQDSVEEREAAELDVSDGELLPELLVALPGRFIGESVEVDIELPSTYSNQELAGKKGKLKALISGIKEVRIPELDDVQAVSISGGRYATAGELRQSLREDLETRAKKMDEATFEQAALSSALESSGIVAPPPLIERELDRDLADLEHRLSHQGIRLEVYLAYLNQTAEQWKEATRGEVESRLKIDLLLEAIARAESIEPSIEEALAELAGQESQDPSSIAQIQEIRNS
ncbi:MAG TPA: trigger factor, partial [Candidatus Dormibacteraeota bacterium]|nr:trigger factor [Candidatus Dormibacteraeota bacterium]